MNKPFPRNFYLYKDICDWLEQVNPKALEQLQSFAMDPSFVEDDDVIVSVLPLISRERDYCEIFTDDVRKFFWENFPEEFKPDDENGILGEAIFIQF